MMELKLAHPSLPTPPIFNSSSFFPKHFALLAQRWKLRIQRISWKGQGIRKLDVVPVLDVNLIFEGQHLDIPSAIPGFAQAVQFEGNNLHKIATSLRLQGRQWNHIFTVTTPHGLPLAKTTGYFLVLAPLVAFCIQCVMAAFQNRAARNLRHQAVNKSGVRHHHGPNSVRWKTVLNDPRDPEALDTEFEPDSGLFIEDKEQLHFKEDMSRTRTELEEEYQKFLSECGMSKWGYWRGGSPPK